MPLSRFKTQTDKRCFICGDPIFEDAETEIVTLDLHDSGTAHVACIESVGLDEAIAMIEDGNRND